MSDYPKLMRRGVEEVTVHLRAEQGDREADGWRACDGSVVTESVAPLETPVETSVDVPVEVAAELPTYGPADDGTGEEPTEGPAHDDTHAKRSRKKK